MSATTSPARSTGNSRRLLPPAVGASAPRCHHLVSGGELAIALVAARMARVRPERAMTLLVAIRSILRGSVKQVRPELLASMTGLPMTRIAAVVGALTYFELVPADVLAPPLVLPAAIAPKTRSSRRRPAQLALPL